MEEYSEGMYYRRKRSLDKCVPICTIDLINNKSEKKQKSQVDSKSTGPKKINQILNEVNKLDYDVDENVLRDCTNILNIANQKLNEMYVQSKLDSESISKSSFPHERCHTGQNLNGRNKVYREIFLLSFILFDQDLHNFDRRLGNDQNIFVQEIILLAKLKLSSEYIEMDRCLMIP